MNNWVRLGAAFLAMSVLPACATVVRGTKTTYRISSTPAQAEVALSTGQTCVTPCKLKLKRKNPFTATITKAGYRPHVEEVESKISGGGGVAAAGNILAGGIIGGVVDGTNGSLNSFYPGKLDVTLEREVTAPNPVAAAPAPAEPVMAEAPAQATVTPAGAAPGGN